VVRKDKKSDPKDRSPTASPGLTEPSKTFILDQGENPMGDKGSKDKGKRESQKKAQRTPQEKRQIQKEKKKNR